MLTAREIYDETISSLPPGERLRLAALILDDLAEAEASVDQDDHWSRQDEAELTAFSLSYAASLYPEDEDLDEPR